MGQVIHLPLALRVVSSCEEPLPAAVQKLSNDELQQAIAGCREVRRQIGLLFELGVHAERVIDEISDAACGGIFGKGGLGPILN